RNPPRLKAAHKTRPQGSGLFLFPVPPQNKRETALAASLKKPESSRPNDSILQFLPAHMPFLHKRLARILRRAAGGQHPRRNADLDREQRLFGVHSRYI